MAFQKRKRDRSRRGSEAAGLPSEPRFLALGRVLRPHGVRGELFIQVLTDYPDRIGSLETVYLAEDIDGAGAVAHTIVSARRHRTGVVLRLEALCSRDQADVVRDAWVLVAYEDAIPLEEGEFYLFQLIGLEVVTRAGEALGRIEDVLETGANDVYVVNGGPHGEVLIPAVPHVVLDVDLDARRVTVELPHGLLELP